MNLLANLFVDGKNHYNAALATFLYLYMQYVFITYAYKNYLHKPDFVLFQQFGTTYMYYTLDPASHKGWCHLIPVGFWTSCFPAVSMVRCTALHFEIR